MDAGTHGGLGGANVGISAEKDERGSHKEGLLGGEQAGKG